MSAYIVLEATGESWCADYRAANLLARKGLGPVWATSGFSGTDPDGRTREIAPGAIVLGADQAERLGGVSAIAATLGVEPLALAVSGGVAGQEIRPIRIAVYGGGGAPYNHAAAFAAMGFETGFVFPRDILDGALGGFDLLAVPGGGYLAMQGQLDPLGEAGCRAIAEFVRAGGMYLGSCAGAFDASIVSETFVAACPQQRHLQMIDAAVWNSGDAWMGLQSPGVGVLRARIADPAHPVTLGMPESFEITHYNGPLYELRPGAIPGAAEVTGLLSLAGTGAAFTPAERFLGARIADRDLLVTHAAAEGVFNAVAGRFGKGLVVLFGSHPEFGLSLDLEAWGAPARLMGNAGFWQAALSPAPAAGRAGAGGLREGAVAEGLEEAAGRLDALVDAAEALLARDAAGAGWLSDALAMSTFGVSGPEKWRRNLAGFRPMAARIAARIDALAGKAAEAEAMARDTGSAEIGAALGALAGAIRHRTPPEWDVDLGYEGLLQQLDRAKAMLAHADADFTRHFPPDENAYAYLAESPFHLAVGSYLAASGVFGNCLLLLEMQGSRLDQAMMSARLEAGAR